MEFITKLLLVAGKDAILVVYDRLSKMVYFVITIKETLAKELARLFKDNVWKLHRFLENVINDKRLQFAAKLTKELNKMLGIETKLLVTFQLQIDGQTE